MASPTGILAMDTGNTSVKCAVHREGRWQPVCQVETRPIESLRSRLLEALPPGEGGNLPSERVLACSVHPPADEAVRAFCAEVVGREPEFFGADLPVPLPTDVREPEAVGTDRLLLALGARDLHGAPCIVVSAGTAVTVDLVDADGRFAGGAIGPGFGLSAEALHARTALLPRVEVVVPDVGPGKDTAEALRRGIYWFCVSGVATLMEQYRMTGGSPDAPVVCTGTDAELLLRFLAPEDVRHEPNLIFRGMGAALTAPS
ncbi:MAG: type III pantothenate kinase [Candidatus Brocadiaceae bacterium]|jgi:type III pantothenate kinase